MKRILLTLTLSLLTASTGLAQDHARTHEAKAEAKPASAAMPQVDDLLDKFVSAIGGKEAVQKQTSRIIKGTMELEAMNMSGSVEGWSKAPNKNAMVIELSGFGTIRNVFDGSRGWAADPMTGLRELNGAELAAAARDADFYQPINMKKLYPKMAVKGKDKVGASEAWVIEAVPAEGDAEKFYFDVSSGLLVRADMERESPQGKMPVEVYFDDYKEVDGVKIAHTMRQVTPAFSLTIKISDVKHNAEIDDAKFGKPQG